MLAPDERGRELDELKFSLASDIVELVVLTGDQSFLTTLRDAVGSTRRLWNVPTADKVSDLLVAGEVGILVLDEAALHEAPEAFIVQIKRQFPDLVIVVAGKHPTEAALAPLISSGTVYRFIHKPMSPGRARLFADAAVKKYDEQRRRPPAARAAEERKGGGSSGAVAATACVVLCATAAGAWILHQRSAAGRGQVDAALIAEPPMPQGSLGPRSGASAQQERLLARAENALLEERLAEAAVAIETARREGVDGDRIAFLSSQLSLARERRRIAQAASEPPPGEPNGTPAARSNANKTTRDELVSAAASVTEPAGALPTAAAQTPAPEQLIRNAEERLQQDRLIEPAGDNAKAFIQTLRTLEPGNPALVGLIQDLGVRLLAKAKGALELEQYDAARSWLDELAGIGYSSADSDATSRELDAMLGHRAFMQNVVPAGELAVLKSVQPEYPPAAQKSHTEGWVELDFTVAETGAVRDVSVHAATPAGVFDAAAIGALRQWLYRPVLRDGSAVAQRARVRIRFTLAG